MLSSLTGPLSSGEADQRLSGRILPLLVALLLVGCERAKSPPAQDKPTGDIVLSAVDDFPCSIEFELTGVTLRSDHAGSIPDPMFPVSRAPDGRLYTATRPGAGQVVKWSANGAFIGTIGRRGDGPGEFGMLAEPMVDHRGVVHVFDFARGRWQRFTPDGEFLASVTLPVLAVPTDALAIVGKDSILSAQPFSGHQFHLVDGSGNVLNSFGQPGEIRAAQAHGKSGDRRRPLAFTGDRTFWAGPHQRSPDYILEEWTLDGSRVRRLVRDVPWLPDASVRAASEFPVPAFHLYAGSHGHLLVRVRVRMPDEANGKPGEDWYEVIDPRVPEVLASQRVLYGGKLGEDVLRPWTVFPGTQLGMFGREEELGLPVVDIVRYRLVPETSRCYR